MRKPGWYDAFIWLVFTALGFLVPFAVGIIVRAATGSSVTVESITEGGQFAVSGAGLLMTTCYFVARPGSLSRLPLTEWFFLVSVTGLISGIVIFILATLAVTGFDIDPKFYQWPSVVLFVLALVLAFIAVGLDKEREIDAPGFLEENTLAHRKQTEESFDATFSEG